MTFLATADPIPALVAIPNVELVTTGEWMASTGIHTFTENDLRAAIAALDDPAVKAPRLRIGHTPPEASPMESAGGFADQPAFGRFTNLRLADNGQTIVADIVGVPAWLAAILPAAYPSRSIEGFHGVVTATGKKHDFVITSVALLGVSMPAVQTLEDLRLAYGDEAPAGVEFVEGVRVAASRGAAMPDRVSASVQYEDVRRSFYEDFATDESGRYWWWIHSFVITPPLVVADDDEGGLWAVPYSIKGDAITWGEPVEVRVQYVEKDGGKIAAVRLQQADAQSFASATESRPKNRVRAATPTKEEEMGSIPSALLERLELPEDATEEQALAKLDELKTPADPPATPDAPADPAEPATEPQAVAAAVDPDALRQLQEDARLGREAREQQVRADREQIVDAKVKAGFVPPASRAAHLAELEKGGEIEKAHRAYLDSLTAVLVPVEERGVASTDNTAIQSQVAAGLAAAGVRSRKES